IMSTYDKEYYQKNKEKWVKWSKGEHGKNYLIKNKERIKRQKQEYNKKNREKITKQNYKYNKEWVKNNRERYNKTCNKWRKEKRKTDSRFRLDMNITTAIGFCLRGKKAGKKWESLVGYTIDDLMKRLEKQFDDKMNWDNYGNNWVGYSWHIDHIKPKSLFKYEKPEDKEFKKCWALENLQPLEKIANLKKNNYYGKKTQNNPRVCL
ncbi:MAG: hypothetical protein AAB858_02125, partial [Patescibacteria group bacterium]